ncbi:hypothetical protein J437_LFUL011291 [Ladona fulva]|uniref:BED-type domain-containing protein n=1 Tax=Ladona fulva TaxID=123851 RepID=A0A8K0P7Z0_LADFU|nr:hypothetical protein J437_LFUL011291 [Ladona fulva]
MSQRVKQKTSSVWEYFNDIGSGQAKCSFCSKRLSYKGGSNYNLTRHLRMLHPTVMMKKVIDTNKEQQEGPSTSIEPDTNELEVEDKRKSPTLAEEECFPFAERHTAENLAEELKRVAREWNLDEKIVAVVSDNAIRRSH